MKPLEDLYSRRNEDVRFEIIDVGGGHQEPELRTFFRRVELAHVYEEIVVPALRGGEALLCVAIRDRPWPPWGLQAHEVAALIFVHPIGEGSSSVSGVFIGDDDRANIGLLSALFKWTLEELLRRKRGELTFVVAEGAVLAAHVLGAAGFERTDDLFLTERARYKLYRADAGDVLRKLGLASQAIGELLGHAIEDPVYERNALFQGMLQLGFDPFWRERAIAEIIPNLGSLVGAYPPNPTRGSFEEDVPIIESDTSSET